MAIKRSRSIIVSVLGSMTLGFCATASAAPVCTQPDSWDINCNVADVASLTSAFAMADANPSITYNIFLAPNTYFPTSPLVLTAGSVNLFGETGGAFSRANQYIIDGNGNKQVFQVHGTSPSYVPLLNLVGLTVQNGEGVETEHGGCIYTDNAELELQEVIIQNCHGVMGAAVAVDGGAGMSMWTSIIRNNSLNNFIPRLNTCGGGLFTAGGGIVIQGGANISQSSIVYNQACRGGGIWVWNGYLDLENSTLAQNLAVSRGGGILFTGPPTQATMLFNTIVENRAGTRSCGSNCSSDSNGGAGFEFDTGVGAHFELRGNIVVYNTVAFRGTTAVSGLSSLRDCDKSNGTNLQVRTSAGTFFAFFDNMLGVQGSCNLPTTWYNVSATRTFSTLATFGLNAMADVPYSGLGGSLPAYKPTASAAFLGTYNTNRNGNTSGDCLAVDQRGYVRNDQSFGLRCDIGSYELNGTL